MSSTPTTSTTRNDFLRDIIDADLAAGRHTSVATRFPPEPNGYLHIGHAKSICLNFGLARDYGGTCNLRFDDTNPTKEDVEYVDSIARDIRWLGFEPTATFYASDYFEKMYDLAVKLITDGKAYVDSLNEEQIREHRGSLTEPGTPSPHRGRSVAENLDLFRRMRAGEFPDGAHVLRAIIDLSAANMKMRDPLLYRIRHAHHHRTGDKWCIYPMYDYAHPISDALEGITHSICTLEFENNRELYDWVLEATGITPTPRQYEFARLVIDYTLMSKRKLLQLVTDKIVTGWDDPRMPTLAGMRRRGYRAEGIRAFCDLIGVAKKNSTVDVGKLEYCIRDDLNKNAPRAMAVLRPLRVLLTNVEGPARELVIERDDFQAAPEAGYLRLAPGRTVRLRHGGCITCDEVVRDAAGEPTALRCRLLMETTEGKNPEGIKVWGVIHWLAAATAVPVEVRLYDRLFLTSHPGETGELAEELNPKSLEVLTGALVDAGLRDAAPGSHFQFERLGYFVVDTVDSRPGKPVFNKIVGLRDVTAEKPKAVAANAAATASASAEPKEKSTRPAKRSGAEYRAEARARDPELAACMARFQMLLRLSEDEADLLAGDKATAALFEATVAAGAKPAAAAKLIINELPRVLGDRDIADLPFGGPQLGALVALVEAGTISGAIAKDVLARLAQDGGEPAEIVDRLGLQQTTDTGALEALVADAIAQNAAKVAEFRAGRTGLLGFFVGVVVKASGGKANPQAVKDLLVRQLS